jgi:uncharacterized membrane protein
MAVNQGAYNLFLAIGIFWAVHVTRQGATGDRVVAPRGAVTGEQLQAFFLLCVFVAGTYLLYIVSSFVLCVFVYSFQCSHC